MVTPSTGEVARGSFQMDSKFSHPSSWSGALACKSKSLSPFQGLFENCVPQNPVVKHHVLHHMVVLCCFGVYHGIHMYTPLSSHLFGKRRFLCQLFSCSPRYWGFDSEPLHSTLPIVHLLFASLEPPGPEVRIGQVKFGSRFKAMAQA